MTKRTPELETAILEDYGSGRTLTDVCHAHGVSRSTVQSWKRADPDFARRYAEAQHDHALALIDDCQRIARDPSSEWVRRHCDETGADERLADHIRHARLRIDTQLRIARILLGRHEGRERAAHAADPREETEETAEGVWQSDIVAILEESSARAARGEDPYVPPPPHLAERLDSWSWDPMPGTSSIFDG